MIKEYDDERINELIKKSFEMAIKDDEWNIRSLDEWKLLYECIDKVLEFVESGKTKEIYVNRNMWYILQDTFFDICDLYGVDIEMSDRVSEHEKLIDKNTIVSKELKRYLSNICNYLNNIKGYITEGEVRFLLECIDDRQYHITNEMVKELSDYVECDMSDDFINKLVEIVNENKEFMKVGGKYDM